MAAVELKGLVKNYGPVTAVDSIDLDIVEGEFIVLLGPSGCGKTTTLRCIAGLEDVSAGEIRLSGELMSTATFAIPPEKRAIGMVFQSYAIWPHMTVAENVGFGLKMKKVATKAIDERVATVLELVGLGEYGNRGASQLSGGQQQRVALARAIILEPKLLLFDEPLSNLDAKLRERMRFELRQLQKRLGVTSIYVTHDQQEAMIVADRVILMNGGKIDQIGSPVEIYRRPHSRFGAEFIGLANIFTGNVSAGGTSAQVKLSDGHELASGATDLTIGQSVDVVFRPEDVRVSTTPFIGINVLKAQVIPSYFLGNIADVFFDVGGLTIRSQTSPPMVLAGGQEVWVEIPPASIILIPK